MPFRQECESQKTCSRDEDVSSKAFFPRDNFLGKLCFISGHVWDRRKTVNLYQIATAFGRLLPHALYKQPGCRGGRPRGLGLKIMQADLVSTLRTKRPCKLGTRTSPDSKVLWDSVSPQHMAGSQSHRIRIRTAIDRGAGEVWLPDIRNGGACEGKASSLCLAGFSTLTSLVIVHDSINRDFISVSFTEDGPPCLAHHKKPMKSVEWLDK